MYVNINYWVDRLLAWQITNFFLIIRIYVGFFFLILIVGPIL